MPRQISPNSLKNLSMPKPRKEGRGYLYKIPIEKVNELFTYLSEGTPIMAAAKKADISYTTAKRYYKRGDATRGITPLIQRLEIFQENISKKMNVLLEENRAKRLEFVRRIIDRAQEGFFNPQQFYDAEGNQIDVYDAQGKKIERPDLNNVSIRDLERIMRLETFLAGGVFTGTSSESKMLSAEEIMGENS
jgi:hypothetical protein